jgi:hypothetical protein
MAMDAKKTYNDFGYLKGLDKHLVVDGSTLTFTIQDGPRKLFGTNGCQVDVLGEAFLRIIENFDKQFPCVENKAAVANVRSALGWLDKRTKRRSSQGIEGTNKEAAPY